MFQVVTVNVANHVLLSVIIAHGFCILALLRPEQTGILRNAALDYISVEIPVFHIAISSPDENHSRTTVFFFFLPEMIYNRSSGGRTNKS
jgi:hypothetical protein